MGTDPSTTDQGTSARALHAHSTALPAHSRSLLPPSPDSSHIPGEDTGASKIRTRLQGLLSSQGHGGMHSAPHGGSHTPHNAAFATTHSVSHPGMVVSSTVPASAPAHGVRAYVSVRGSVDFASDRERAGGSPSPGHHSHRAHTPSSAGQTASRGRFSSAITSSTSAHSHYGPPGSPLLSTAASARAASPKLRPPSPSIAMARSSAPHPPTLLFSSAGGGSPNPSPAPTTSGSRSAGGAVGGGGSRGSAAAAAAAVGARLRRAVSFSPNAAFPVLGTTTGGAVQQVGHAHSPRQVVTVARSSATGMMAPPIGGVGYAAGSGSGSGGASSMAAAANAAANAAAAAAAAATAVAASSTAGAGGARPSISAGNSFVVGSSRGSGMLVVPEDAALAGEDAPLSEPGLSRRPGSSRGNSAGGTRSSGGAYTDHTVRHSMHAGVTVDADGVLMPTPPDAVPYTYGAAAAAAHGRPSSPRAPPSSPHGSFDASRAAAAIAGRRVSNSSILSSGCSVAGHRGTDGTDGGGNGGGGGGPPASAAAAPAASPFALVSTSSEAVVAAMGHAPSPPTSAAAAIGVPLYDPTSSLYGKPSDAAAAAAAGSYHTVISLHQEATRRPASPSPGAAAAAAAAAATSPPPRGSLHAPPANPTTPQLPYQQAARPSPFQSPSPHPAHHAQGPAAAAPAVTAAPSDPALVSTISAPPTVPLAPSPGLTRGVSLHSLPAAAMAAAFRGVHTPGSPWSTAAGGGGAAAAAAAQPAAAVAVPYDAVATGVDAAVAARQNVQVAAAAAAQHHHAQLLHTHLPSPPPLPPPPSTPGLQHQGSSVRRALSTLDAGAPKQPAEGAPSGTQGMLMALGASIPAEMRRQDWRMEDFTLLKRLYKGNYSAVHKALCRISMRLVVVKVYDTTRMTELARNHVRREAALHSQLSHDNILNLYAVFSQGPYVMLVEEVAEGGDLYQVLKAIPGHRLPEDRAVSGVLSPLLRALAYLHAMGICHRDIKLENILFSDRQHSRLLLADFGIALSLRQERAVTRAGTTEYMSPEQLRCPFKRHPEDNKDRTDLHYGAGVDVWATGVLAFELLHGYPPFLGGSREETEVLIATAPVQVAPQLSPGARDFLMSCLQKDPVERPTVPQLLQHPWMRLHGSAR